MNEVVEIPMKFSELCTSAKVHRSPNVRHHPPTVTTCVRSKKQCTTWIQTFKQHLDHGILNLRVRADIHEAAEGQPKVRCAVRIHLNSTWIPNTQTIHVYSRVHLVTSIYSLGSSRRVFCMQGHQASNTSPYRFRGSWCWTNVRSSHSSIPQIQSKKRF